jgi:hypothetical protein
VKVSPTHLVIPPGQSRSFSVTITRTNAPLGQYTFGSITWVEKKGATSPHNHSVRSNIAVRPVALAAPAEVTGSGASGSAAITVSPGYTGTLNAAPKGLAADTGTNQVLNGVNTNFSTANPQPGPAVLKVTTTVPANTRLARFATFDADYPAGTDLDVFVYRSGTNQLLGQSAGGTAEEIVTFNNPTGAYDIYVVQFALAGGATSQTVKEHAFVVPNGTTGTALTTSPATQSVTTSVSATVNAGWAGLAAGLYLGVVDFNDGTNAIGSTIVTVRV